MSKILKTEIEYRKRAAQLIRKCAKELEVSVEELDMRQLVVWLCEKRPEISRPTWRQYKSSVAFFLEKLDISEETNAALDFLREQEAVGCVLKSNKTSSRKLKKISLEDWKKIDDHLRTKPTKWSQNLRDWLKAGLLTGLRPIEWRDTKFFMYRGNTPALLVSNAKHTNGRSNGLTRTLLLDELSISELKTIKDHLSTVRSFISISDDAGDGYDYFYAGCALTLNKACRKVWTRRFRHITLYSTRHQFSANAKSSGFSKAEVAAMMGHAVDLTATLHYGKKISGNEPLMVKPVKEEVDTVKIIPTMDFKDLIRQKRDNLI